jgi:hypothetical protein
MDSSSLSVCALLASLGLAVGATACSSDPGVPCGNAGCFAACGCYLPETGTDAGTDAPTNDAATADAPGADAAGD